MHGRWLEARLARALRRPYVHVLFGARQTGKSTLLRSLLADAALWLDFSDPAQRSRYLARPEIFVEECRALTGRGRRTVVVDEAQAVPRIFDAVQHLYDRDHARYRFVLSGSSARKLRVTGANLLPGRAVLHRLFPLVAAERPSEAPEGARHAPGESPLPLPGAPSGGTAFPAAPLLERLTYGELPGVVLADKRDREGVLRTYAHVYLEEELRREALIKDWPTFARFLRLAAVESGSITNYAKISREAGCSLPTVKSHYQLLEDMFIGFHLNAFSGSARKHVLSTPRFFFFDLGVRHAAAELGVSRDTVLADPGPVFEQWVGIELWKRLQYLERGDLTYYRTKAGAEVDFVVVLGKRVIPIETNWTESPSLQDARHLRAFLAGERGRAPVGYLICRCERPRRLADDVVALPWWCL